MEKHLAGSLEKRRQLETQNNNVFSSQSVELAKHIDSYVNNGDGSLEPRDNGDVPRSKSCTYCAYVTFMSKCNFYFL